MIDNYAFIQSKDLMKTIIGNYENIEYKYEGYTSKKEAIELICSCYIKGWNDLGDNSVKTFHLEPFKDNLKKIASSKPEKQDFSLDDILESKKY